jgi:hypothetical protein
MCSNALYVFDSTFGSDVVNLMKEFTPHPFTESREMGDDLLLRELCSMYDNFCVNTQKRVKKLNISMNSCRDFEFRQDIQESIADLYYDMNCVTDYQLMKFQPRVCTERFLKDCLNDS